MKFRKVGITVNGHSLYVNDVANVAEIKNSLENLINKSNGDPKVDELKRMMGMI